MRHFFLALFLLFAYVFSGHTAANEPPSLVNLENTDEAPLTKQKGVAAPAPAAQPVSNTSKSPSASPSVDAGAAVNLNNLVKEDQKTKTEEESATSPGNGGINRPVMTAPGGVPSLGAEEQADAQTPAEKQAQQQQQDAVGKTNAAQAKKEQADKDKAAAEAELKAAKGPPEDPEKMDKAKQHMEAAEKEEKDAKKAQEDAERSTKDANKAFAAASKNGAKLRAAKLEDKTAHEAEMNAQIKADAADKALTEAKASRDPEKIKKAEEDDKKAHKDLLKAQSASAKIEKNVSSLTDAGQTATSRAALATKALSDADKAHADARNKVFADQEALAKAEAGGDKTVIENAQKQLKDDQAKEKTTATTLASARSDSQKANQALNTELMKTETPEETRDRLAAEANSNLSAAQISQRSAQDAVTVAQSQLDQARENGASDEVQQTLGNNVDAAQAQLNQANENLTTATQSANVANANADSPLGVAQNNLQQLQSQQQDLQLQEQDAASAAGAAGIVITSAPEGSPKRQAAQEVRSEELAKVAELQKKIDANSMAIGKAQAQVALAHQNEEKYQKALAEKRLASKIQRKSAKKQASAQNELNGLLKTGAPKEQLNAAEAKLKVATDENSKATTALNESEKAFLSAQELAQTPLQRLRMKLSQDQAKIAQLQLNKAKIEQDLAEQQGLLSQQIGRDDSKNGPIEAKISRLKFQVGDVQSKVDDLQKTINADQAKVAAADQATRADALGELNAIGKRLSKKERKLKKDLVKGTDGTRTPEEEMEGEEADDLDPRNLGQSDGPDEFDGQNESDEQEGNMDLNPLASDAGTEDERGPQIPTFQRGSSQPVFGPGGGPVANFTSPGGAVPNFNKAAGALATFAAGAAAVPTFNSIPEDVFFGNASAPLPWSASSPKVPTFGTNQAVSFGGSGAPMPVFGSGSQNAFGGAPASAVAGAPAPLPLPGNGLTKIKAETHLAELAPPVVSEEKKQALMLTKNALTSAEESLKAAERTENLRAISNAQINQDLARLKYEQALNNASPLGVPETEASGWWNNDPISPYSGYNVDGGGLMNAPLETSERTEHFILNNLEVTRPAYETTLPDGARALVVQNVGLSMKKGKAIPTIVKSVEAAAAA